MGFVSDLKDLITVNWRRHKYAKMLNGQTPVFNSFGKNIYAYDIMKNAIAINCTEMSKLQLKHIRIDDETDERIIVKDSVTRLLKTSPNPYMTISDFIFKCNWLYETTDNCYIYPTYVKEYNKTRDYYRRIYTGFYPLDPETTEFTEDDRGNIYVRFTFGGGYRIEVPYADVIHWKKNVTSYDVEGGYIGDYKDKSLINLLNADNTAVQGIDKAVKTKLSVNGILKYNSMLDDEIQEKKIAEFEEKLSRSKNGIVATDIKADYTPLNIDPKTVDKNTMEFIQKRILAKPGVPLEIYNRNFTEEQYQGYYEVTLSPRIKSLGEAFDKCLFTPRELSVGNQVTVYNDGLRYASLAHKISAVDIVSRIGALTNNQVLDIFGYPPFEGGDVRMVSLNYMDANYITEYQMNKKKGEIEDNGQDEQQDRGTENS